MLSPHEPVLVLLSGLIGCLTSSIEVCLGSVRVSWCCRLLVPSLAGVSTGKWSHSYTWWHEHWLNPHGWHTIWPRPPSPTSLVRRDIFRRLVTSELCSWVGVLLDLLRVVPGSVSSTGRATKPQSRKLNKNRHLQNQFIHRKIEKVLKWPRQ